MASHLEIVPSSEWRKKLHDRGGAPVTRCFQCATCCSVCKLAPEEQPFPRRQMLWSQWGLSDRMASDPGLWLCHQCNDCTTHCPRDARPGDILQAARSLAVERLAVPGFLGKLVGNAKSTWPILLGIPFLFWVAALYAVNGLTIPESPLVYDRLVPHWLIYAVFFSVTGFILITAGAGAIKFWNQIGRDKPRQGSFIGSLIPVLMDIAFHGRFGKCDTAKSRKWGHFALLWGFVLAAVASAFIIVAMYILMEELPLPFWHPFKIIGNVAAVFLVVGGFMVLQNRLRQDKPAGNATAYDNFFLSVVLMVVITGVLTEVGRYLMHPELASWIYILHLTSVLSLFVTFPFSKFAHLIYRTLAMVHERMTIKS